VEVRGMKANDRLSYGNLLFHPNKNSWDKVVTSLLINYRDVWRSVCFRVFFMI
jgi:hypothetical protein